MSRFFQKLLLCAGLLAMIPLAGAEPVPDFQLLDINPNSVRHQSPVSPRDYLLQVSGFYFGQAG
jgi:hypothetical protein